MEIELDELYMKIGKHIISMIPVQWSQIYYLGEIEKGKVSMSSVFYFKELKNGNIVKSHNIPEIYGVSQTIYNELLSELNILLLDLYSCFEKNSQPLWEQMSFSINADGKFNVEFYYDIMNENDGGQVQREVVWAYKTFGLLPKNGSYTRKILDKYLQENE